MNNNFHVYGVMIRGRLVAIGKCKISAMQNARKYGWKLNERMDPRGNDDACRDLSETTIDRSEESINESEYNTIMSGFSEGDADRDFLVRNTGNGIRYSLPVCALLVVLIFARIFDVLKN